jgi:hypothetical protein
MILRTLTTQLAIVMLADFSGNLLLNQVQFSVNNFFHRGVVGGIVQLFGSDVDFALNIFGSVG